MWPRMKSYIVKAEHPSRQQRGTSDARSRRSPSADAMSTQPGTMKLPPVLPAARSQKDDAEPATSEPDVTSTAEPITLSAPDAPEAPRKQAVAEQGGTNLAPGTGSRIRRSSLGMPNRITLDAEQASVAGPSRIATLRTHDRPQHPIHLHDEPGHASAFRQSIASYVGERFPHIEKTTGPGRDPSSSTSVVDAFLGAKWTQHRASASPVSEQEDSDEGKRHPCHPRSLLFFPHYAFVTLVGMLRRHSTVARWAVFVLWVAYVTYALVYNFYVKKAAYDWCHDGGLISWTSVVILLHLIVSRVIIPHAFRIHRMQEEMFLRVFTFLKRIFGRRYVRIFAAVVLVLLIALFTQVGGHLIPTEKQMTALCGYFVILLIAYLLSVEPEEIRWGVVAKNLLLQVLVVYLMMVWRVGRIVLQCIATKIAFLFDFSKKAAWVLFSDTLPHMLSIELLSSLTLTGSVMHLLYYTGQLQGFLHKTGILLELITGTTTVEAVSGALCTLFGGIETAVILEPYIVLLTMSELHAFVTSGIASMTGLALTMYMKMGVEKITIMTVNFATFNGALAVSKVMYPETDTSVTTYRDLKFMDRDEYNAIDAGVRGAIAVLRLLAQLVAVLISFIAMVNMANDFIEWLLENIGIPGMDIVGILSVVLRPLIFLMGIEWQYSERIARLFATKTVLNEYFAYAAYLKEDQVDPMETRENAVTVALLYGFSNFAHVGATIAYLTAVAPERRQDISSTVPRALLSAILTNMLTAALVGALVSTESDMEGVSFNVTRPAGNQTDLFSGMNGTALNGTTSAA